MFKNKNIFICKNVVNAYLVIIIFMTIIIFSFVACKFNIYIYRNIINKRYD